MNEKLQKKFDFFKKTVFFIKIFLKNLRLD